MIIMQIRSDLYTDGADGVIAYEEDWLGAEGFVSFDSKAVSVLQSQGIRARLLS